MGAIPLVVDLDGTLLHSDMLCESAVYCLSTQPLAVTRLPIWLSRGKAYLKSRLAEDMDFDPSLLPYNLELLNFLRCEYTSGRTLVLCTATHEKLAQVIADYLSIFSEVMGSTTTVNLNGKVKGEALVARYGEGGFDYAGNSFTDLAVWMHARRAIIVNAPSRLIKRVNNIIPVERLFAKSESSTRAAWRALRPHQWLKNILIFAPCVAAHRINDLAVLWVLLLAFFAFGTCASSVYLLNDLLDLENDRRHPSKCKRPLAAGALSIPSAAILILFLLGASIAVASFVNLNFFILLTVYFCLTTIYSFVLKHVLLLDCIVLAILYTLRVIGGWLTIDVPLSFWMLTFSVFLFLALAFLKRYAELTIIAKTDTLKAPGRDYYVSDLPLLQSFGVSAAYTSVLVLALYLNSNTVQELYNQPMWLWLEIPVLTFWVSWLWMQAHRGRMDVDPVLFSIKNPTSLACGVVFTLLLVAASFIGSSGFSVGR